MTFSDMNYLAIIVAAVAAWIVGALWYGLLGKHWVAALGKTMEAFKQEQADRVGKPAAMIPFLIALLANLIMAWVLYGIMRHIGPFSVRAGLIAAAFVWLGFVVTTMAVNNAFAGRKAMLTIIDSGYWLAALLAAGAVIGAFGG